MFSIVANIAGLTVSILLVSMWLIIINFVVRPCLNRFKPKSTVIKNKN